VRLVRKANHLTELTNPSVTRHAVQWIDSSVGRTPGAVSGAWLTVVTAAVLAATLSGLLAAVWLLGWVAGLIGPMQPIRPLCPISPKLAFSFFCLLVPLTVPLTAAMATDLEKGTVYFARTALLLVAAVGTLSLTIAVLGRSSGQQYLVKPAGKTLLRGTVLGMLSVGVALLWLGIPWGATWAELVPSPRRWLLAAALGPLLLPWTLAMAWGISHFAGPGPLLGGMLWLSVAAMLWLGHVLLAAERWPLFGVPAGIVVAGFLVPWPLWFLPTRPGLTVARAVSHAAGTAWLLACHVPFVHAG